MVEMNRRKFLAFLGIAAAAPKVLAKVAEGMKKEDFLRKYPLTPEDCLPHDWQLHHSSPTGQEYFEAQMTKMDQDYESRLWWGEGSPTPYPKTPRVIKYKNSFQITKESW